MTLDEVTDIEILRRAAKLLEAENLVMAKTILKLKRELQKLKGKRSNELRKQIADLEEQLANRNHALFGESSEKGPRGKMYGPKVRQPGHGRREQPELDKIVETHTTHDSDTYCDLCGGEVEEWTGQFEESDEIDLIERKFVLKKHRKQKHKCGCGSCIVTAAGPRKLMNGARYSIDVAIHIAIAKYADHLPLERQVRGMKRDGLVVDSQTLWDQLSALARYLEPVYERLHQFVLAQSVIGVDETHWRLMGASSKSKGGKGKKWQVWAIICPEAVHYSFEDSRSAEAAKNVLGDLKGIAICDGYSSYEALITRGGEFVLAHCWAHVRRKFLNVEKSNAGKCAKVLDLISTLYMIESDSKEKPPDERLTIRKEQSKAIILAIQNWALDTEARPDTSLSDALNYMRNRWKGLVVFLDNIDVDLDNNKTERALRTVVLGRKNHYGSRSVRGTEVAALFYTLIESAKLSGIEPRKYLKLATDAALGGEHIPLPHELN